MSIQRSAEGPNMVDVSPLIQERIRQAEQGSWGLVSIGTATKEALALAPGALGTTAGPVQVALNELKAQRVEEVCREVREGLEREGLTPAAEGVQDLLAEAFPIMADAETGEKRRLIADLILNAARLSDAASKKVDALFALRTISEMPPEAAAVFGIVAAEIRSHRNESDDRYWIRKPFHGISALVVDAAVTWLTGRSLLQQTGDRRVNGQKEVAVSLGRPGLWLADWIVSHRAADYRHNPEAEKQRNQAAIALLDQWIAEDEAAGSTEPPLGIPPLALREVAVE